LDFPSFPTRRSSDLLDSLRNSRPKNGRSPSTGTLSLCFFTFSVSNPPRTTVCPSQTLQLVTTCRERKIGNGRVPARVVLTVLPADRKSTRLNSSHLG